MSRIKAPIAGTVDNVGLKAGEMANPGFTTIVIVNNSKLRVKGEVAEGYVSQVRTGSPVQIVLPDANGKVIDNTFSAGHKIDEVRVETHEYQFLYPEGDQYHFMHTETYEQITLAKDILDAPELLKEGTTVKVIINAETEAPLSVDMPASVVLEVTYSEPGVKGNTSTNATKPATVETGATVNVPLFINEGDKIKIETATGKYMERV